MKRDLKLIRKIVQALEASEDGGLPESFDYGKYTEEEVGHHLFLMLEGGLVRGEESGAFGDGLPVAVVTCLTWAGHEFAAASADTSLWERALRTVKDKGGAVTFTVLTKLLEGLISKSMGA